MPAARPLLQPRARKPPPKLRSLPTPLRIEQEEHVQAVNLVVEESPASALSDQSEADSIQPPNLKPRSLRNQKKLSLNLSAHSNASSTSLNFPDSPVSIAPAASSIATPQRRPSIVSLPNGSVRAHRRDEEASPSAPYVDGPIEILSGIWIGSEDNARDWKSLVERGIRSILNVAKEVTPPYAPASETPLRSTVSTPNLLLKSFSDEVTKEPTYVPPNLPSGRPAMHYLRLPWSHGQTDLVRSGFVEGMAFVDRAQARGDAVLIHCQCGVSRSATMVIALVMRAAHSDSPSVPPEISALRNGGMHASYAFVKQKSKWVGPNMSLMYQLLEYERALSADSQSPTSDHSSQLASEEAEWGRRRQEMEEETSPVEEIENFPFMHEARALDLAMEQRVARKGSQYSTTSSTGSSGHGMGSTWKSRFGYGPRSRAGSVASNFTNHSILSEDLLEEDEDNVDSTLEATGDTSSASPSLEFPSDDVRFPMKFRRKFSSDGFPPPTAPASKQSFGFLPPPSAGHLKTSFGNLPPPTAPPSKQTFTLSAPPKKFQKKRPPVLLPTVPPSPVGAKIQMQDTQLAAAPPKRIRQVPTPLRIPSAPSSRRSSRSSIASSTLVVPTPSQTLFVFPPEESVTTPSTMTLMSTLSPGIFPSMMTPRVSTFNRAGKRRSLIVAAPPTPTTACSRVDVLGYVAKGP